MAMIGAMSPPESPQPLPAAPPAPPAPPAAAPPSPAPAPTDVTSLSREATQPGVPANVQEKKENLARVFGFSPTSPAVLAALASNFQGSSSGESSSDIKGTGQATGKVGPAGLSAQGSTNVQAGQFGSGKFEVGGKLPGGADVKAAGSGSYQNGIKTDASASVKLDSQGLDAQVQHNTVIGQQVNGNLNGEVKVGNTTVSGNLDATALNGLRAQVGGATLGQAGPGASNTPGQVQVNRDGLNVNLGGQAFLGQEVSATGTLQATTPLGTVANTTQLRAANGTGAAGGVKVVSNPDELTLGGGFSVEEGSSIGGRSTTSLTTPGGSSFSTTGIGSLGGQSYEGSGLFSRNNKKGTTELGFTAAVSIPGTPATVGIGGSGKVTDDELARLTQLAVDGGRPATGLSVTPGQMAASKVKPVMDAIPKAGNDIYKAHVAAADKLASAHDKATDKIAEKIIAVQDAHERLTDKIADGIVAAPAKAQQVLNGAGSTYRRFAPKFLGGD